MRPMSSEALGGRPKKPSGTESSSAYPEDREHSVSSRSMTYFLADEATVAAASATAGTLTGSLPGTRDYGVRSLEASVEDSDLRWSSRESVCTSRQSGESLKLRAAKDNDDEVDEDDDKDDDDDDDQDDLHSITSLHSSVPAENVSASPQTLLSGPLTPLIGPASDVPGTPRSGWNISDEKEEISHKMEKRPESSEAEHDATPNMSTSMPQLIMPEITMPSRRPFTIKGKQIGRLKILIAGDSGIGKTSLIKSIVQTCEDIVHVDPLSLPQGAGFSPRYGPSTFTKTRRTDDSTKQIAEVYASTRPYPHWWSEIDDNRILRRRKSRSGIEEQVIERNLCFVDTPGYGTGTSFLECIEPVVNYVEAQFERTYAVVNSGEGDLMSLISGSGTTQVDVVFYVILHRLKPVDIEFMRRLSPLTSVLPVIAKADTLTLQQVASLKLSILNELRSAGIKPFLFGSNTADMLREQSSEEATTPCAPFAVSSIVASDAENMDASVLMSPDYVPPLVDTELKELVQTVFDPDNIAWLRHVAAKKYMQWKSAVTGTTLATTRGLASPRPVAPINRRGSPSASGLLNTSLVLMPAGGAPDSFALAKVTDHTQREERLAKVRLSRWAHDLQRSLHAERERYERLAKGERAVWLTERLGEVISDGQLVPVSSLPRSTREAVAASINGVKGVSFDIRDPLGLLELNEMAFRRGVLMLKIAGVGGVIGFAGVWIVNRWSLWGAFQGWLQMQGE